MALIRVPNGKEPLCALLQIWGGQRVCHVLLCARNRKLLAKASTANIEYRDKKATTYTPITKSFSVHGSKRKWRTFSFISCCLLWKGRSALWQLRMMFIHWGREGAMGTAGTRRGWSREHSVWREVGHRRERRRCRHGATQSGPSRSHRGEKKSPAIATGGSSARGVPHHRKKHLSIFCLSHL